MSTNTSIPRIDSSGRHDGSVSRQLTTVEIVAADSRMATGAEKIHAAEAQIDAFAGERALA